MLAQADLGLLSERTFMIQTEVKRVTEPYIRWDEIFMFCREDYQVGAEQADKRGEKCTTACLFCIQVCFFLRRIRCSSPFRSSHSKKFCRNPPLDLILFCFREMKVILLSCGFSVRKGSTWSPSSSPSSTPANLPNPNRAAQNSQSSAPRRKTTKRCALFKNKF